MVGLSVFLGNAASAVRAIVQVSGQSLRITSDDFLAALPHCPVLDSALKLYADYYLALTAQSAACNRLHPVNERCARWLLTTHDRAGSDEFRLTQELLSQMLGVRRPSVTVAASALAHANLITYRRGRMKILDREGLEAAACECHSILAERARHMLDGLGKPALTAATDLPGRRSVATAPTIGKSRIVNGRTAAIGLRRETRPSRRPPEIRAEPNLLLDKLKKPAVSSSRSLSWEQMLAIAFGIQPGGPHATAESPLPTCAAQTAPAASPTALASPTVKPQPTSAATAPAPASVSNSSPTTTAEVAGARATPAASTTPQADLSHQVTQCGSIKETSTALSVEQAISGVAVRDARRHLPDRLLRVHPDGHGGGTKPSGSRTPWLKPSPRG